MEGERKALDATAVLLTVVLSAAWGFGHVAAKFAAEGLSLVFQSGLRSVVALGLVLLWCRWRGVSLWQRDGTLGAGLLAGFLFAVEFLFISAGLITTDAARMVVFLYVAPSLIAFEMHFLVRQERLNARQWMGVGLTFAGILTAFGDGLWSGRGTLLGDFFGVLAAVCWALLALVIRTSRIASAGAAKTLAYQMAVSGPFLMAASMWMGEPGITRLTMPVVLAFAYQCLVVAFASLLLWFWLLRRYLVARLTVLTSLTPLFGVLGGVVLLDEPITATFGFAVALVVAGIFLVNRRV